MLASSMTWLGVHLVLDHLFKQTLCVRYFTEMILVSFGNEPVNISRYYVLAILIGLLGDILWQTCE